jgi:hypothetical protein
MPHDWRERFGGRLLVEDDAIDNSLASDKVKVPRALDEAITGGDAKFMQIDDQEGTSLLSTLEYVGYFPEGITVVLHKAEQPYVQLLIGEKVTTAQLRRVGKAVTALLREEFGRGKAGRPLNLAKRRLAKKLLQKPGSLKDKAFVLAGKESTKIGSQQSYLSRLRNEQK